MSTNKKLGHVAIKDNVFEVFTLTLSFKFHF